MIILHSRGSDRYGGDMWHRDTVQLGWYLCQHSTWAILSNFHTQEDSSRCPINWATITLSLQYVHNDDGAKSDGNGAQQRPKDDGNQQRTSCEKQHIILGNNTLFIDVTTVLPAR